MKKKCIKGQKIDFQGAEAWSASKSRRGASYGMLRTHLGDGIVIHPISFPCLQAYHVSFLWGYRLDFNCDTGVSVSFWTREAHAINSNTTVKP